MTKHLLSMILLLTLNSNAISQLIPQNPRNVGIFLYEGVELLDFAGPGEVFSASGFNTITLTVDGLAITSQRFVEIKPQYSIHNAPTPDIIVLPGGNAGPSANDPDVVAWIKKLNLDGTPKMSGGRPIESYGQDDVTNLARLLQALFQVVHCLSIVARYSLDQPQAGNPGNERVDAIAVAYSLGNFIDLYEGPLEDYAVDVSAVRMERVRARSSNRSSTSSASGSPRSS